MFHLRASLYALCALAIGSTNSGYIPPGPRYTCPAEHDKQLLLHPCVCEAGSDQGIYVSCRQAGLAVLSVGLGNVATLNVPIEQLLIRECHIDNLFGPLFYRTKVRVLRIEDTPIRSIDQYTFMGINNTLQELHVINSRLEKFPKEAFRILGNLTLLNLDNHDISTLDKDSFAMSLAAGGIERLHITNGNLTELPVEPFQALRKLKTLDFHNNGIKTLKRNQFKGLRDVELLDLSHNSITKLDGSHLGDLTKMGWCNVSHNSIADIPRGMFARNAVLKVLHLNSNKIKKLDTNSFRGMRFLRRLYLQDNQITDVGRGTFGGISRIGTIDLARNNIKKIDFQMFYQLNYVEIIDVSENQVTEIQKLSFKDLYLTHINISRNQISKIENGAFENCANITVLDLSYNNLTDIPRNAFDVNTFPSELQLSYNGFTELNQVPVHNMTGLRVLNVSHNQIHTIPMRTFPKLYELHTVDVSHNKVQQIASAVFQSLFSLRFIYLSHNDLEKLKPTTFGTLPTLLELDLSYNKLQDISKGSLANLASCRILDVSHNQLQSIFQLPISLGELNFAHNNLSEIKDRTWPSMNALLRLNLSHNHIEDRLGPETFRGLLTLQKLDLTANGITKPPWEALSSLSSLQYLYLQHNNLTNLNKAAFGRLPIVFELDMAYNQISNISERAFEGLLQLLTLSLRGNQIKHIPNGAFKGLVSMRELDLSHNLMVRLDNKTNGLLDDCLSLEMVNLSYNDISFITRKMFPSSPWIPYKLRSIDLSHNVMPVVTFDLTYGTKTVYHLNLSHNIINDIRKDVLSNLTSLRLLDLSHNQLQDMSSQAADTKFRLPINITELILSHNDMEVLPMKQIVQAKKLQHLDVRQNHLQQFDPVLVQRIRADRLQVEFQDNHLTCDCVLRPLKHYLNHLPQSVLELEARYTNLSCYEPQALSGETVLDVDEDRLVCPPGLGDSEDVKKVNDKNFDFVSEPDLAFRDVQFAQKAIFIEWYVLSSQDVADFHIFIRDSKNNIYFSNVLSYIKRSYTIEITENEDFEKAIQQNLDLELCVLPRSSDGMTRKWFQNQCKPLPKNFEMLKKDLELGRKLSSDVRLKRVRKLGSATSSSTLHLVSDSVLITLVIFLGICVPYVTVLL